MPIADSFAYDARWDSVGLSCAYCRHFHEPANWPDTERVIACRQHAISLASTLGETGFMAGEWFCRDFELGDFERANGAAVRHFVGIRGQLQPEILYGCHGQGGVLQERPFAGLGKTE